MQIHIEWSIVLPILSIGVSILLAWVQIDNHIKKRKEDKTKQSKDLILAPAERESISIKSSEGAVTVLEKALNSSYADNVRYREQILNLEQKTQQLELEKRNLSDKNYDLERQLKDATRMLETYTKRFEKSGNSEE